MKIRLPKEPAGVLFLFSSPGYHVSKQGNWVTQNIENKISEGAHVR